MTLNLSDFKNIDGVVNLTAFNAAWAEVGVAHMPKGYYEIDTDIGLVTPYGGVMTGDGMEQSYLVAQEKGASLSELAAYSKGSVIKRSPPVAGVPVSHCRFSDFGIILQHPATFNVNNYKQIGMDMRNISRSHISRVFVGNDFWDGTASTSKLQGYGFVLGTSNAQYCGGVGNVMRDCAAFLSYKNFAQDDLDLCDGTGGAHKTLVDNFDSQWAHHLMYVEKTANGSAGCAYTNLSLQQEARQPSSAEETYAFYMGGKDGRVHVGYLEYTEGSTTIEFPAGADNNVVDLDHYSATTIVDNGTDNIINGDRTGSSGGGGGGTFSELIGGTAIGDMTGGGGLAAAFDGITNQTWANSAKEVTTTGVGNVGKNWGSNKTVTKYEIWGCSDYGYDSTPSGNTVTVKLQGWNGFSWVDLHTDTFSDNNTTNPKSYSSGIDISTAYSQHRVLFSSTPGGGQCVVAEVKFYETV